MLLCLTGYIMVLKKISTIKGLSKNDVMPEKEGEQGLCILTRVWVLLTPNSSLHNIICFPQKKLKKGRKSKKIEAK